MTEQKDVASSTQRVAEPSTGNLSVSVDAGKNTGDAEKLFAAIMRSADHIHFICALDKQTRKFSNVAVKSPSEAVSFATAYSAMSMDAYFAFAEYETSDNRKSENAVGAFTFIVDIDVGPDKAAAGKGYETIEEALAALKEFCEKAGLPYPPIVVNSGTGLHGYWPFDAFLQREEWIAYAAKFKALMKASGLLADHVRTADIAGVLRVPGTFNYKYNPPRPVTILSFSEEKVELTVMQDAIDAAMVTLGATLETSEANTVTNPAGLTPAPLQAEFDRDPPNLLTLASALKTLTPDCDDKTWKFHRLATMAYEARYFPELHDALYNLAKIWSSGELVGVPSVKWNTPGSNGQSGKQCFDRVWKRFLTDNYTGKRASLGTIYYHAQQLGWVYPSEQNEVANGDGEKFV